MGDPGSYCLHVIGHVYTLNVNVYLFMTCILRNMVLSSENVLSNGDKKGGEKKKEREKERGGREERKGKRREGRKESHLTHFLW